MTVSSKPILKMPDSKAVKDTHDKVVRHEESVPRLSNSSVCGRNDNPAIAEIEELGRLLGVIAHEIKNPLSTIKVNLRLLDEQLQETASSMGARSAVDDLNENIARARRKISLIDKETSRLEQILDGFLRYANTPRPHLSPVDLNGLLSDIIDFYLPQAAAHSITLRQQLSKEPLICQIETGAQTLANIRRAV